MFVPFFDGFAGFSDESRSYPGKNRKKIIPEVTDKPKDI